MLDEAIDPFADHDEAVDDEAVGDDVAAAAFLLGGHDQAADGEDRAADGGGDADQQVADGLGLDGLDGGGAGGDDGVVHEGLDLLNLGLGHVEVPDLAVDWHTEMLDALGKAGQYKGAGGLAASKFGANLAVFIQHPRPLLPKLQNPLFTLVLRIVATHGNLHESGPDFSKLELPPAELRERGFSLPPGKTGVNAGWTRGNFRFQISQ